MSGTDATVIAALTGPLPDPGAPLIPDVAIARELGRGGMGAVWLGRQIYLDRPVAVKALLAVADEVFAARFRREATILAGLHHPHIVACHSAGIAPDGRPYLVMEFVDGPDLRRWIAEHGPLPPAAALRLAREVAEGLAHAAAQGIIHRDVKPENVLLARRPGATADDPFPWTAKLADLGLARPAQAPTGSANLTRAGQVLGTPATMAPEQFDDPEGVDLRADIYGLGCVLFHALTGSPAFTGTSFAEIVASKVHGPSPDPSRSRRALPAAISRLCARMLARDRAQRPQDYAALIAELRTCEGGQPPRRRWGLALAAGGLALLAGAAVLAAAKPSAPVQPVVPVAAAKPGTAGGPPAAPAPSHTLPPLDVPRPLFGGAIESRLAGWTLGPAAQWSPSDEESRVAANGHDGWISRPLPGLPAVVIATVELQPEHWEWWLAGVRLADGRLVGLRIANLGSALATMATWATADPLARYDAALTRDLPGGGGLLRLEITSLRLKASLAGVGIGDLELPAPPVALVLAAQSDRFVTVADLRAAPP